VFFSLHKNAYTNVYLLISIIYSYIFVICEGAGVCDLAPAGETRGAEWLPTLLPGPEPDQAMVDLWTSLHWRPNRTWDTETQGAESVAEATDRSRDNAEQSLMIN